MRLLKQSTAANIMVLMTDATDHVTGKAGLTLTITASKDGAAFASISPTVTERGSGWYNIALTSSHSDTLGDLALHVTATGADPTDLACRIVAGSLDADVSTRLATSGYTAPDNSSITTILGRVDVATSTRLASASYTTPPTAAAIRAEIDANSTKLDVAVSTRMASGTVSLTAAEYAAIADKILGRNLAGSADGGRTVTDALRASRNKSAIVGTTLTVYQEDDTTAAWTATIATASRDALASIDPA